MKILFLLIAVAFSLAADTKEECFKQYRDGKINKKELMQCGNIESMNAPKLDYVLQKKVVKKEKQATTQQIQLPKKKNIKRQINDDYGIKTRCADKWGTNYRMIEHCFKNQKESLKEIQLYRNNEILKYCSKKWNKNYRMIKHCYDSQLKSKKALGY